MTGLTLPDGWERLAGAVTGDDYCHAEIQPGPDIYADSVYVEVGDYRYRPDEARTLAVRLIEAADIADQLHGGAR